jgi:preprotein translocase subunit SecY
MTWPENMRKYGGFIPGIRPGKRTPEYIDTILSRITLVGAGLSGDHRAAAEFPDQRLQGGADSVDRRAARRGVAAWFTQGLNVPFPVGGTSLLIVVGVAMDTVQQIESQLIMRHYDGS